MPGAYNESWRSRHLLHEVIEAVATWLKAEACNLEQKWVSGTRGPGVKPVWVLGCTPEHRNRNGAPDQLWFLLISPPNGLSTGDSLGVIASVLIDPRQGIRKADTGSSWWKYPLIQFGLRTHTWMWLLSLNPAAGYISLPSVNTALTESNADSLCVFL